MGPPDADRRAAGRRRARGRDGPLGVGSLGRGVSFEEWPAWEAGGGRHKETGNGKRRQASASTQHIDTSEARPRDSDRACQSAFRAIGSENARPAGCCRPGNSDAATSVDSDAATSVDSDAARPLRAGCGLLRSCFVHTEHRPAHIMTRTAARAACGPPNTSIRVSGYDRDAGLGPAGLGT